MYQRQVSLSVYKTDSHGFVKLEHFVGSILLIKFMEGYTALGCMDKLQFPGKDRGWGLVGKFTGS